MPVAVRLWLAGLLCGFPLAAADSSALDTLRVVEFPAPAGWGEAMQGIGRDRAGRVFILRTETLEVYPVTSELELGKARALEAAGLPGPTSILRAAMGRDSGEWVLISPPLVRWFVEGRERSLPRAEQSPIAGAISDGKPLLLLRPMRSRLQRGERPDRLPTLVRWDGRAWVPLLEEDVDGAGAPGSATALTARAASLAIAPDGDVWMAATYAPRVRRLSPTGKVLLEVELEEEGHQRSAAAVASTRAELAEEVTKAGSDPTRRPARRSVQVMTSETMQEAAAVGRDGRLYVVARDPEASAAYRLRRWDPVRLVLEEVALPMDVPGALTMTGGADGLHFAHWNAVHGRAFVAGEELESAAWREVEGVTVDGVAVPADRRAETPEAR